MTGSLTTAACCASAVVLILMSCTHQRGARPVQTTAPATDGRPAGSPDSSRSLDDVVPPAARSADLVVREGLLYPEDINLLEALDKCRQLELVGKEDEALSCTQAAFKNHRRFKFQRK